MNQSVKLMEMALPNTSNHNQQHRRQLSYSRGLSKRFEVKSAPLWHQTQVAREENSGAYRAFLDKSFVNDGRVHKDEMLRILRGRNYMLNGDRESKCSVPQMSSNKIYRNMVKLKQQNSQGIKRVSTLRHLGMNRYRCPLKKAGGVMKENGQAGHHLRVEKWLDEAKVLRM